MVSPNQSQVLIANLAITDTKTHTYRTNPYSAKSASGIQILPAMLNRQPEPYTLAVVVSNSENETLSVSVIGNIDTTQAIPDYTLGATGTIDASASDILYIYMKGPNAFPSDYISLSLSFATAPTSGSVIAYAKFYGGH